MVVAALCTADFNTRAFWLVIQIGPRQCPYRVLPMDTELLILAILSSVPSHCSEALAKNSELHPSAQSWSAASLNLPRANRRHKIAAMPPKRWRYFITLCPFQIADLPRMQTSRLRQFNQRQVLADRIKRNADFTLMRRLGCNHDFGSSFSADNPF